MRSVALVALLLGAAYEDEAVAREWQVRARAEDPRAHAAALAAELQAPRWRTRAVALDVLFRAAAALRPWAPAQAAEVLAACADEHPNVRARALEAAGAAGLALPDELAARLARDPVGSVRLALARALEHASTPVRAPLLAALALDLDERVATAARHALLGLAPQEPGLGPARLAILARAAAEGHAPFLRFVSGLAQAPADGELLAAARTTLDDDAARGWIEVLALAWGLPGEVPRVARLARDEGAWDGAGARLLERAGRAPDPALAPALCAALDGLAPGVARRGLVALLVEGLEPEAPAFLAAQPLGAALRAECLEALGLRRDAWRDAEWAPWVDPAVPVDVRRACQEALSGAYVRSADPGAGRGLVALLADPEPELAAAAFESLCAARVAGVEDGPALRAAFARLAPEEKLRRAGLFTRARAFPALRAEWLALGAAGGAARAAACELLAGFEGDAGVVEVLSTWLATDLAAFAAGSDEREGLVQAELRALARASQGAARAELLVALRVALGRSTEIGKVAAAALGRSAEGRAELGALLAAGALASDADRRTRIEACLALARAAEPELCEPAVARLLADHAQAAWDLRQRLLEALAESTSPAAEEGLLALAARAELEPVERLTLATLLARRGGARVTEALVELVRGAHDVESRRVAVAGLAGLGAGERLAELATALAAGALPGGPEELALLAADLLLARARLAPGTWACAEWLRAPAARAAEDLLARFRGEERPAPEFEWRHELELARVLAASDVLAACLADGARLARLDGRLLVALAEVARAAGRAAPADELYARATIALLGERDPPRERLAWVLARRLALARAAGAAERVAVLAPRLASALRAGALGATQLETLDGTR